MAWNYEWSSVVPLVELETCSTCKNISMRLFNVRELHPGATSSVSLVCASFRRSLHLE